MEKRPRVGLANISYTKKRREKRTEKKNGSSDLLDLGTFRLIRRSSEEYTWSGVPLALQDNCELKCLCISGHVQFLHSNLEKRNYQVTASANFRLGK